MNATSTITTSVEQTTACICKQPSKAVYSLDVEQSFVQVSWTSTPTPNEVAECAAFISTLIQQYHLTQLLHDVRQIDYVNIDLQRCLTHVFCPLVLTAGITQIVHLANYILPDLLVIDQISNCVKHRYVADNKTRLEICTTSEGAMEWLQNNTFRQPVVKSKKQEEVKVDQVAAFNAVSIVDTLINMYQEKASWLSKILFSPKALFSDL